MTLGESCRFSQCNPGSGSPSPAGAAQAATDADEGSASPDGSWEVEAQLLLQDIIDDKTATLSLIASQTTQLLSR